MFRKIFHPMQNQDPTLHEKSWGVFRIGRYSAITLITFGSFGMYLLSYWLTNIFQALIIALFSSEFGLFSGNGLAYTLHFLSATLLQPQAFFENEELLTLLSVFDGLPDWGFLIVHCLSFALMWWFFIWKPFMYIWTKSRNLNHHEYGDSRIATPKEIRWQTFKVPDRYYNYGRHAGFPVMHKFNWRGKLNKAVMTEKDKLQDTLSINDVVVNSLYKLTLLGAGVVAFFLACWSIDSARQYFTFKPQDITWYARIPHVVPVVVSWIVISIFKLAKMLFELQGVALHQPFYMMGLFYFFELLGVIALLTHIKDIHLAYKRGWIYALIHGKAGKRLSRWRKRVSDKKKDLKDEDGVSSHPFREAVDCLFHHPKLASLFSWLVVSDTLFPLNDGITGWYYLSPRAHNVWIYGTSGSGKGQMVVNPQMDINSRADARDKPNMIVTDPKGESVAGAYEMLRKRNYSVKVLNILDLSHSMSFNPLRLVIKYAQLGAVGQAEDACSQLSYTIYDPSGQGQNSYFYTSAASLFDAMTFALLALAHSRYYGLDNIVFYRDDNGNQLPVYEDGQGEDGSLIDSAGHHIKKLKDGNYHSEVNAFDKVTIRNISEMVAQLGGQEGEENNSDMPTKRLMIYFDHLTAELDKMRSDQSNEDETVDDNEVDQLSILDQAVQKYQQSKLAGSKTAGSIYSTFLDRLRIYMSADVAKMTSMDNFDPAEMGFDRLLTIQFNRKFKLQNIKTQSWGAHRINGVWVRDGSKHIESNKSHLSEIGLADIPFERPINGDVFFVTVDVDDERVNRIFHFGLKCTKRYYTPHYYKMYSDDYRKAPMVADMTIVRTRADDKGNPMFTKDGHVIAPKAKGAYVPVVIDRYTQKQVLREVEVKLVDCPSADDYRSLPRSSSLRYLAGNPESAFISQQAHFLYNPRPTAWFVVAPQNKQELNQLGTFAIDQTFNVLSNISMKFTNGRHVQRPLQMILDELGNLPAIPHLDRKASFGRSQHIYIMPIFQAREQADAIYKQDTTNIIYDNCPTTVYILSNSEKTIKDISDGFGNRTVTNTSRSHDPSKIKSTNYNENEMKQPVMMPDKLRNLKIGETAILRTTDRTNVWGKDTKPWPVFDQGNYILPYSYWFLGETFNHGSLGSVPIVTPHKYLNLESLTIQFGKIYLYMEEHQPLDKSLFDKLATDIQTKINKVSKEELGGYRGLYQEIMNKASDLNENGQKVEALQELSKIKDYMTVYRPIAHMNKAIRIGQFMLAVIEKHNDLRLLDEAEYQPYVNVYDIYMGNRDFFNPLTLNPKTREFSLPQLMDNTEMYSTVGKFANQFRILNEYVDEYLGSKDVGLIKAKGKINVLTDKAKSFINHPEITKNILKHLSIDFHSKVPLSELVNKALDSLVVPKGCEKYRGLMFLMRVLNPSMVDGFSTGKNDANYVIKINIYTCAILSMIDAIVTADNDEDKATSKLKHNPLKVSNDYSELVNKLNDFNASIKYPNDDNK